MEPFTKLSEALALGAREHIALVGGGGKTALLFALAEELCQSGKRVLTSTTTKVWHAEALKSPRVIFVKGNPAWRAHLQETLEKEGHLFLAEALLDSGKVQGITPSLADELYEDASIDYLLIEADGSAGRPVKAPDWHEPVIPASVTRVVALMGLEALGRPMGPEVVFRQELVAKITGLKPGESLTVQALSRL
ncbi:MAG: selenium cofactor biosynthesis protein YqeC, partial [Desulfobacterales bacterium]|nr:selenium cofactor biosynthesis protein YqeC [Desulfobacterales bacterium]